MKIDDIGDAEHVQGTTYQALIQLWDSLTTPVYAVESVSEEETLVEGAEVRFIVQHTWIYRDAALNYELLRTHELAEWTFDVKRRLSSVE